MDQKLSMLSEVSERFSQKCKKKKFENAYFLAKFLEKKKFQITTILKGLAIPEKWTNIAGIATWLQFYIRNRKIYTSQACNSVVT